MKPIALMLALPALLFAQDGSALPRSPKWYRELGGGYASGALSGNLEYLTGKTFSKGFFAECRYVDPYTLFFVRYRAAHDQWGQQRILGGLISETAEVKRTMATVGIGSASLGSDLGSGGGALEAGIARWDIKSTYAPFADKKYLNGVLRMVGFWRIGFFYVEGGGELQIPGKRLAPGEDDYVKPQSKKNEWEYKGAINAVFCAGLIF